MSQRLGAKGEKYSIGLMQNQDDTPPITEKKIQKLTHQPARNPCQGRP
jgi:uncharacterized protein YneF (UPF0154 family)